ncbi:tyrosine-protein phosphatase non-receptor type 23 [Spea bombifrons]|uniref:tyrosine-protein phosphatase non-receptor type 23 n=1 Tax=Spea bombifrons TaxID=233779 RepID=UPI00234A0DF3|nr:tyrosine-protein phosphatase non-receptor type 23 [Spea bombifrons]
MEAVPRMPMIWLDLKEAGEFGFNQVVKQFILKNYGENPDNYNEELKKLEQLRQSAINVPRDFEGCSVLRKYFGQLHYLQSRVPMESEQEAAVPITWTEIFSGKSITHDDIQYEQSCVLYNLGALHSMLGAMDKRVSEEGMKVSCTHFQCSAGAFAYLRDHFAHSYSVDMSHQILNLNINLMLGQAQECLLEKSMLDNRKSFLVARISAQVVDYYKEACRALENSETASLLGKIQKDWKKLVQMKIYYFAAIAHLHMGKQAEEQQKYGEQVAYLQSALDKLNEAIKQSKGQPAAVQDALRFTMDVIGGKFNSAKKDNDFIYHESVPALETLQAVKGAPLVKALPVNPTDPAVTGPDIFSKLVPMAAHEASSLYSEDKAKLLREILLKIEEKNEVLDQFTDSLQLDPDTVDNLDLYSRIPSVLMEKCAALSVRPDTVKSLVQSMQVLSGVYTDVEASLKDIKGLLEEHEKQEKLLQEDLGRAAASAPVSPSMSDVHKEWAKYMEVHEKASFTNTELHKAMNLHISNLRLLSGPLDQLQQALPAPSLTEDDAAVLQNLKRILGKVQEMRDQRLSLEQQLRDTIQKDDITTSLVTTDRSEMKKLFAEQLKKYDQLKVYIDQNLSAQENILKALTEANVKYAPVRKVLSETEQKWNHTVQTLIASYEAYEDLMKKSQEGKDFYADLESKVAKLLERARAAYDAANAGRLQVLEREMKKKPPPRPTAPKPALEKKPSDADLAGFSAADLAGFSAADLADIQQFSSLFLSDLPEELKSLPPEALLAHFDRLAADGIGAFPLDATAAYRATRLPGANVNVRTTSAPVPDPHAVPFSQAPYNALSGPVPQYPGQHLPPATYSNAPASSAHGVHPHFIHAPAPPSRGPPPGPGSSSQIPHMYPAGAMIRGHVHPGTGPAAYPSAGLPPQRTSPQHAPMPVSGAAPVAPQYKPNNVGFGVGQQAPASRYMPGPLNQPPEGNLPFQGPAPRGSIPPQMAQGVRPATTTVDSIQGPISSYAASRLQGPGQGGAALGNQPLNQHLPPAHSQGSYMGPQGVMGQPGPPGVMGQPAPFPYSQGGIQNYIQQPPAPHRLPHAQPAQMFHAPGQSQRGMDAQPRAQTFPGQQQYGPPYPMHVNAPPPQHPVYPPQGQPAGNPQPNMMPPQQHYQRFPLPHAMVPGQPASQMPPQRYPGGHQDKQPPPSSMGMTFPGAVPRASPPLSQPSSTVTVIHALPPGSTSQMAPSMPFAPRPQHAVPPPNVLAPAVPQMPLVGPNTASPISHHGQPPGSPAIGQLPGAGIVSAAPAVPSPAPSPQPALVVQPPAVLSSSVPTSAAMPQRPPPSLTPGAAPLTQSSTEVVFQRQSSSTDDLLSSSPESQHGGSKTSVGQPLLQPTKADSKDGQKPRGIQLIENDPYEKPEHIVRLLAEVGRFRAVVAALDKPVAGAATQLDAMWKEFQDAQEKEARHLSIAIARCYAMKNRHQDIMPYDKNRIVLQSGKDDYINASSIEELSSYCPAIIATQAPLVGTASDFWLMIHEQKVSLVVMLVSELEIEKQKVVRYFPVERGQPMVHGQITLTLTSQKAADTHVERVISLQYKDQSLKRSIIHLQFTSWPELGLPDSKGNLLRFIHEVHSHYLHQRPLHTPIVVHCSSGVGRTGAFCIMYAAVQEVEAGNGIPDLAELVKKMRQQRKHMLHEKLHLKFCYEAVLKHAELVLQRHGISTPSSGKPQHSVSQKTHSMQDPQDIVLGGDMPISSIQATIAKLSIRPCPGGTDPPSHYPLPPEAVVNDLPANDVPIIPSSSSQSDLEANAQQPAPQSQHPTASNGSPVPAADTEPANHAEAAVDAMPCPEPTSDVSSSSAGPSSSSLNLLASMTPETFNLDSSQRGKQKTSKQSFLQPQNGGGLLRGSDGADDPLSMLDPLWTMNKA